MTQPIHGVAVDAGSGLAAAIRATRGQDSRPDDLMTFKRAVLTTLGSTATTVLVDAECGPDLIADYPPGCAPMMAYEADVYHISSADRITLLPPHLTVADFPRLGVRQLKFFMYYAPDDDPDLNARKQELVAEVGADCRAQGVTFLMEPLVYHRAYQPGSAEFADLKPDLVRRSVATFAAPRFHIDLLKIEVPVDLGFVEGFGLAQRSRSDALATFRDASAAAGDTPIVYLSAGVPFDWFEASLVMAGESGAAFRGFMCGRAIWSDAIPVFGQKGETALIDWLADTGQSRLKRLIATL